MDYKYSPYIDMGDILLRQSSDSGSTWSGETQITYDHFAWGSDVASMGDTIAVVWEDGRLGMGRGSIYCTKSTDNGVSWDEAYWVDADTNDSRNPSLACSDGKLYLIWYDTQLPDSTGIYFSRYKFEADDVGQDGVKNLPEEIILSAHPNPFNSSTTISVNIDAFIGIYDITGRRVAILHAQEGQAVWDASGVSSGVYFARAQAGNSAKSEKLILMK
jgi:hypothetical protein